MLDEAFAPDRFTVPDHQMHLREIVARAAALSTGTSYLTGIVLRSEQQYTSVEVD